MEAPLTGFVGALRLAGLKISAAETIDAVRAVEAVGYDARETLRAALRTTLAKGADEAATHDRLFDLWFSHVVPEGEAAPEPAAGDEGEAEPGEGPGGEAGADQVARFMALASGADRAALALALEQAANAAGAGGIRFETQAGHFARRMLEVLGVEAVEARMMEAFAARTRAGEAQAARLIAARTAMMAAARAVVARRFEAQGRLATERFMEEVVEDRPLDALSQADLARMQRIVARMARRLADRHGRRLRATRRGRLDVPATLRRSLRHDGIPFDIRFRRRRRDRPRIVAICDVSGSVARHVRFLLLFLHALEAEVADLRLFAFSSQLEDIGALVAAETPEAAITTILRRLGMGSTDYGRAWSDMMTHHRAAIDRHTTLLVLGDARSNHADPRLDLVAELAAGARRLVWLNPEPPALWGTGDSVMPDYRVHCTRLAHVRTVRDLERALDEILDHY